MSAPVNVLLSSRLLFLTLFLLPSLAQAQVLSRSGAPAPRESHWLKRPFPCDSRQVIFEENFSGSNLPGGWTAQARDTADLNHAIDTIYQDNWQPIVDFKDETNGAVASPSWHSFDDRDVPTDNWLISPEVTLGTNTCFSWVAYSQDRFFPESYEVLLSPTAGVALEDFTDTLALVANEAFLLRYRTVNLAEYAGQTVRVAFRHTSTQKFILVLDDIRFAEVARRDAGVVGLSRPAGGISFDSSRVTVTIRNYGSDSLNLDSVRLAFRDQNTAVGADTLILLNPDKRILGPNDTTTVSHPQFWNPASDSAAFDLWVWTELPGDPYADNDTLYRRVGVGVNVTRIDDDGFGADFALFPNPASGFVMIRGEAPFRGQCALYDMRGRVVLPPLRIEKGRFEKRISVASLPTGMYLLRFQGEKRTMVSRKLLVE